MEFESVPLGVRNRLRFVPCGHCSACDPEVAKQMLTRRNERRQRAGTSVGQWMRTTLTFRLYIPVVLRLPLYAEAYRDLARLQLQKEHLTNTQDEEIFWDELDQDRAYHQAMFFDEHHASSHSKRSKPFESSWDGEMSAFRTFRHRLQGP